MISRASSRSWTPDDTTLQASEPQSTTREAPISSISDRRQIARGLVRSALPTSTLRITNSALRIPFMYGFRRRHVRKPCAERRPGTTKCFPPVLNLKHPTPVTARLIRSKTVNSCVQPLASTGHRLVISVSPVARMQTVWANAGCRTSEGAGLLQCGLTTPCLKGTPKSPVGAAHPLSDS